MNKFYKKSRSLFLIVKISACILFFTISSANAQNTQINFGSSDGSVPGGSFLTTGDLLLSNLTSAQIIETISGQSPDFYFYRAESGYTVDISRLYDGVLGTPGGYQAYTVMPNHVTLQFNLNTTIQPDGYDLGGIRTYASWADNGRSGQQFSILYSTVSNPGTFFSLADISPFNIGTAYPASTMVELTNSSPGNAIAKNVASLQFVFNGYQNSGTAFREFQLFAVVPNLYVGSNSANSSVSFSSGSSNYTAIYVGYNLAASNSMLTVANTNTSVIGSGDLTVGYNSQGNCMVISNRGAVSNANGIIGNATNSLNNQALVTGTASAWTNGGILTIGANGSSNAMIVSDGGSVFSIGGTIGSTASNNQARVGGAGSTWSSSDRLYVGEYGSGNSLSVSNEGSVSGVGFFAGFQNASSNNSVSVSSGATLVNGYNYLAIGWAGSGNRMVISDGGSVTSAFAARIGNYASSSNNQVVVMGTSSSFNIQGLNVGDNGSGNSMIVSNGGSVSVGSLSLGSYYMASNNWISVTGSNSLITASQLYIGKEGSSNSIFLGDGASINNTYGYIGYNSTASNNSVLVSGRGSVWNNSYLTVGFSGAATLTIGNDGSVNAGSISIASQPSSIGTINIGPFEGADSAGTISAPTIVFGLGSGAINFNQSSAFNLTSSISGFGLMNQFGIGTTTLSGNSSSSTAPLTISAGTLNVTGALGSSAPVEVIGGILSGSGSIGNVSLDGGGLYPSAVAGTNAATTLTVNTIQFASGSLSTMNINSSGANDVINTSTSGIQINGGTLNLLFAGEFHADSAESWSIWTTQDSLIGSFDALIAQGALSGSFTRVGANEWELSGIPGWGNISFNEVSGIVTMAAVPEPSTYALFGIGAIGMLMLMRRKKAA